MFKLAAIVVFCVCTAYPQPYTMNIRLKGGAMVSIPTSMIRKLTFSGRLTNVGEEKVATIVRTFAMFQNYPNPFNPSTTIEYELPAAGDVEIRIFNVNGQLVRSFAQQHHSGGVYTAVWDGMNASGSVVASGLYFYQVKFENSVLTKKMLLLR